MRLRLFANSRNGNSSSSSFQLLPLLCGVVAIAAILLAKVEAVPLKVVAMDF